MTLARCFSNVARNYSVVKSSVSFCKGVLARNSSIWEPDYLIFAKTKTPEYDLINVQIKGYDFAVLEKYKFFIQGIANKMNINVVKSWPAPQQDLLIHHYKENSSEIKYEYNLKLCERNVQIVDVKSHIMPLFIEAVVTACPPGINLSFHEHEEHMEESRYVPNLDIAELEEALEEIGSNKKKKKSFKLKNFSK